MSTMLEYVTTTPSGPQKNVISLILIVLFFNVMNNFLKQFCLLKLIFVTDYLTNLTFSSELQVYVLQLQLYISQL